MILANIRRPILVFSNLLGNYTSTILSPHTTIK